MSITNNLQADLLLRKGQSFTEKNRYSEAIATFNKALEMNPNYNFVHLHKGLALSRFNKYKEAVASVEHAINTNQKNDIFWYFLGKIHYEHKNYESAIEALEQARKLDPSYIAPLAYIGLCKMSCSGEFEDGYSLITKNYSDLRYNGFESRLLLFCETFLFNNGDKKLLLDQLDDLNLEGEDSLFDEQSLNISLLARIFRSNASKHYLQGIEKMKKGDLDGCLVCFATAVRHNKNMLQSYKRQIQVYVHKKKYEEALKITRVMPKKLQDFDILYSQGLILFKLERNEEAAKIFKRLCNEYKRLCSDWSSGFSTCHSLGLRLIALQDENAAFECFQKAVEFLHEDVAKKKLQEVYTLYRTLNKN